MERTARDDEIGFPAANADERELLLSWLAYLRGAILRKIDGLDEAAARWRPGGGHLLPLLGIVDHLTHVEWRWIDGTLLDRAETSRSDEEFTPPSTLTVAQACRNYRSRWAATDAAIRALPDMSAPCAAEPDLDARWVVVHLINETARHAGHADATRELLDGTTGE